MVKDTPSNPEKPKRSYHYTREKQLEIEARRKIREAKKKAKEEIERKETQKTQDRNKEGKK